MTESRTYEHWQIFYHSATSLSQCLIISFLKNIIYDTEFSICQFFVLSTGLKIRGIYCMYMTYILVCQWILLLPTSENSLFYIHQLWLPFLVITVLSK